jgi:hypothetical protein
MNKYPVYIVSKGRHDCCLTANFFIKDGLDFLIAVEPQEYDLYAQQYEERYLLRLPFSNLGLGSYPARNYCWEHSMKNGHSRHWVFDDNIGRIRRLNKGKRIEVDTSKALYLIEDFTDRYTNVAISGFQYQMFVTRETRHPIQFNCHVYSAMLIKNDIPYRWRMKYNEDVDLCLQVLHDNWCTVLFNAVVVQKTSTIVKMKGGNQTELYFNNDHTKKTIKAMSLQEMWPQYAQTKMRFNRPHHYVDWSVFKQPLIRRTDIDWNEVAGRNQNLFKLVQVAPIKSPELQKMFEDERRGSKV